VVTGLKHQEEKRGMDHFAGLDVSVKDTSVCIVGWHGQDRSRSEGCERTSSAVGRTEERPILFQADRTGSGTIVVMALIRSWPLLSNDSYLLCRSRNRAAQSLVSTAPLSATGPAIYRGLLC